MPVELRLGNPDTIAAYAPRYGAFRMTDARISTGLPSHPKTRKLIRRLGPASGWSLVCLFLWTASNRHDGDLSGLSGEDIELAADWSGDPGVFLAALCEVRFLDGQDGSYTVHDWATHNPWAAAYGKRKDAAVHAARMRWASAPHAEVPKPQCPIPNHTYTKPNPKQKPPSATPTAAYSPPPWVPAEAWAGFDAMRRRGRHPLTVRAASLIVLELQKLQAQGHDPAAVLDQSTRNGWRDVFPIRTAALGPRAGPTAKPKTVAAYDAIGARIDELSAVVPSGNRPRLAGPDPA